MKKFLTSLILLILFLEINFSLLSFASPRAPIREINFLNLFMVDETKISSTLENYIKELRENLGFSLAMMKFLSNSAFPTHEKIILIQALLVYSPDATAGIDNFNAYYNFLSKKYSLPFPTRATNSNWQNLVSNFYKIPATATGVNAKTIVDFLKHPDLQPLQLEDLSDHELLSLAYLQALAYPNNSLLGYYFSLAAMNKNPRDISIRCLAHLIAMHLLVHDPSPDRLLTALTGKPNILDINVYRKAIAYEAFILLREWMDHAPIPKSFDTLPISVIYGAVYMYARPLGEYYDNWFLNGKPNPEKICEARLLAPSKTIH